ncbi:MAG: hypothetical protein AB7P22_20100, partial [Vicinamibacterales bacterium]
EKKPEDFQDKDETKPAGAPADPPASESVDDLEIVDDSGVEGEPPPIPDPYSRFDGKPLVEVVMELEAKVAAIGKPDGIPEDILAGFRALRTRADEIDQFVAQSRKLHRRTWGDKAI